MKSIIVVRLCRMLFLLLISQLLALLALAQDYYSILGLNKDASDKDVKSAYRQLSKRYHPDKNPGDENAHQRFIEVGEAYEVLSDPGKRELFDKYGADGVKNGGGGDGPGGGFGGFHDPFDIFEQMFNRGGGGGFGGGFGGMHRAKGASLRVHEELSLKDYYRGTNVEFELMLNDVCDHCDGSGSEDGKVETCPDCGGQGIMVQIIRMGIMTQKIQQPCGRCGGRGHAIKNHCKVCGGHKVVQKPKSFHVEVPAGAPRDHVEVRHQEADQSTEMEAGDILVEFSESDKNNMGYRRRGDHLFRTEVLSAREALAGGWSREIEYLDDARKVKLQRPKGNIVRHGEIEQVQGFGMPKGSGGKSFGDLFIEYAVVMPAQFKQTNKWIKDEL